MAITHVGTQFTHNTPGSNNSGNHNVSVPAGTQNGDFMILCTYGSTAAITVPTGWTNLFEQTHSAGGRSGRLDVYYRVASSEPSSYSISSSNNTRGTSISVFRGVDIPGSINDWNMSTYGTSASHVAPSVTTTKNACRVFTVIQDSSDTPTELTHDTTTPNVTELEEFGADNGTNARTLALYLGPEHSSGSISGITITTIGTETYAIIASIALTPADEWVSNQSDVLTLSDTASSIIQKTVNVSDTCTLNDTPTSQSVTRTGAVLDRERLSDSVATQLTESQQFTEIPSDTETLSDTTSSVHSAVRSQSDELTLADTASRVHSIIRSFTDDEGLSDVATDAQGYILSFSDTATLADTLSTAQGYTLSFTSDSVLLGSQLFSVAQTFVAEAADYLTLSDSVETEFFDGNHERAFEDGVGLEDSAQTVGSFIRNESDVSNLSDSSTAYIAKVSNHSDTEQLSDSVSISRTVNFSEAEGLSDAVTRSFSGAVTFSDGLSLADAHTSEADFIRSVSDTETLADSAAAETGIVRLTDTVGLSDSFSITHIDVDDSSTIGNYTATLIQGPADVYIADFGTEEPETIFDILSDPDPEWQNVGGTQEGVELEVAQEYEDGEFEQLTEIPIRRLKRRRLAAKTVLAEPTLQNILYGLNGGTIGSGSGYQSYTPADVDEATELEYRAVMLYGWAPGDGQNGKSKRRVVIMRKCLSVDNVEMSYKKEDQTGLSITWAVHRVDNSTPPFLIIDEA